jgi:hypothetical protein
MAATLANVRAAHRQFVKKVHGTKFILTGAKLRAVQCIYVGGTFVGCMGVLKYFTPPQEEIIDKLSKPNHVRQMQSGLLPPQLQELQNVLAEAKARKDAHVR